MATQKFPKTVGECIDLLYTLRAKRISSEKKIEAQKSIESALRDHILHNFARQDLDGAKGKLATASIKRTMAANVTDWDRLWAYILKNKAFDMVQRRVSVTACRERWDAKKAVPGVEQIPVEELSLTKAG